MSIVRVAVLSDIHSNLEALTAVIDDANGSGGFDETWALGDLVGYGPDPAACIELLRQHDARCVAGNHDLAVSGRIGVEMFNDYAAEAARWTVGQLGETELKYLRGLPLRLEMHGFTAVHGSPRDPVWEYVVNSVAALAAFEHIGTPRCLVGHSHVPFVCGLEDGAPAFRLATTGPVEVQNGRAIVNPGSVGQSRDGDPRSSYAVYDSDSGTITHHRVVYDIPATQRKMIERGLPHYLAERLTYGR